MTTLAVPHRKAERLVARITPADKALIERAATRSGQSVASFVVSVARTAAAETLATHERIELNAEQSRRFVEALLAPPRAPSARMKRAMRLYRRTVTSNV